MVWYSLIILFALPPVPPDYKLQIGDEIVITVSGNINFTYSQVVSPEGGIFIQSGGVPLLSPESEEIVPSGATVLGIVKVLNLTLEEAQKKVEEKFKRYFKNIEVFLTITKFEDVVYVEGSVRVPGAYPFFPGKTVRDYIGLAGGPTEAGDIENVRITIPDKGMINGALDYSPDRNSVISVPYAFVYVKGEVNKPGSFPYQVDMDVHQYIGMAGGATERADLKRSYVIKKGGNKVSVGKAPTIEKGDIIVVRRVILKWWEDYLAIASTATSILIAWLTLQRY